MRPRWARPLLSRVVMMRSTRLSLLGLWAAVGSSLVACSASEPSTSAAEQTLVDKNGNSYLLLDVADPSPGNTVISGYINNQGAVALRLIKHLAANGRPPCWVKHFGTPQQVENNQDALQSNECLVGWDAAAYSLRLRPDDSAPAKVDLSNHYDIQVVEDHQPETDTSRWLIKASHPSRYSGLYADPARYPNEIVLGATRALNRQAFDSFKTTLLNSMNAQPPIGPLFYLCEGWSLKRRGVQYLNSQRQAEGELQMTNHFYITADGPDTVRAADDPSLAAMANSGCVISPIAENNTVLSEVVVPGSNQYVATTQGSGTSLQSTPEPTF